MIIIDITYTNPLSIIDQPLTPHKIFVEELSMLVVFVNYGRKVPRNGGIILEKTTLSNAKELVKRDPFFINNIAEFSFTEFIDSSQTEKH